MDYYNFIVKKEDQSFVSIIKDNENEVVHVGLNKSLYSVLTTDEATARANFTLTGHLPNEKFEELMSQAKGEL
tara:strand:- start:1077 stop:1295 length:219 start_codon:yes stop_codon:yes gene_type:complete